MSTDEQKIQLGDQILNPKDLRGSFTKGKDTFLFKFPTPRERARIEQEIAVRVGVPIEHFNRNEYLTIRVCVYLENILVEKPKWWTAAEDCYDETLLFAIFDKFMSDYDAFRRRLQEGKFSGSGAA